MRFSKTDRWLSIRWTDRQFVPICLSAVAVFLLDVVLPLGVASGVLHVAVVLLALRVASGRFVTATAVLCSGLTLLDMLASPGPGGTEWWKVIVNRGLSLLVIWVTAVLGQQRNRAAEADRQHLADLAHLSRQKTAEYLAGALAHELNQPLTAVALHAEVLVKQLDVRVDAKAQQDSLAVTLREIAAQAHRASEILRSLRGLIRRSETDRHSISVADLIEESVLLMEPTAREAQVEIRKHIAKSLPLVSVDRIQIEQVLLNLMQNGIESLKKFMATARDEPATRDGPTWMHVPVVEVRADLDVPGWVRVSVSDNGPGIPAESIDRVFEPFHSTSSHGLGLGLAISRSILEAHSGRLRLEQTPDKTTFRLDLPTDA